MTVYVKTKLGLHEVQARAHALPAKTRQALIMVDGKRDDSVLCDLVADAEHSTLDTLLDLGLIEPSQQMPLDNDATAPPRPPARKEPSLDTLRREVVRALNDALGPEAEAIALRVEKAKTAEDLSALIGQAAHVVRSARGDDAGIAFAARFTR